MEIYMAGIATRMRSFGVNGQVRRRSVASAAVTGGLRSNLTVLLRHLIGQKTRIHISYGHSRVRDPKAYFIIYFNSFIAFFPPFSVLFYNY